MASPQESCEYLVVCPMFAHFGEHNWKVYITLYCHGNFTVCRCRRLLANGESIPAGLLPYGGQLRKSGQALLRPRR